MNCRKIIWRTIGLLMFLAMLGSAGCAAHRAKKAMRAACDAPSCWSHHNTIWQPLQPCETTYSRVVEVIEKVPMTLEIEEVYLPIADGKQKPTLADLPPVEETIEEVMPLFESTEKVRDLPPPRVVKPAKDVSPLPPAVVEPVADVSKLPPPKFENSLQVYELAMPLARPLVGSSFAVDRGSLIHPVVYNAVIPEPSEVSMPSSNGDR